MGADGRGRGMRGPALSVATLLALLAGSACAPSDERGQVVSFPASALGAEAELLAAQIERFRAIHPEIRVEARRTPDAADLRHQLYVQWLSAALPDPDVLQLDVVWTAEFAAAGWLLPLDGFAPVLDDFFPAILDTGRWRGSTYGLPWFADVGMLYWRTDLLPEAPRTHADLERAARSARERGIAYGLVWQGARYEGLVTVFTEYLAAFGGAIQDPEGRIAVDSPAAVRALEAMCRAIAPGGSVPREALTWHEEETRAAFQSGSALFMRNWPYAFPLLQDPERSAVAGRFAVTAMPAAPGGTAAAALGGSLLAVNRNSDAPEAAYALVEFLTQPEQMLERARVLGQYPARPSLYASGALDGVLPVSSGAALEILEHAVARPGTPIYAQLSGLLQVELHRALSGQAEPHAALERAARAMREQLARAELAPPA